VPLERNKTEILKSFPFLTGQTCETRPTNSLACGPASPHGPCVSRLAYLSLACLPCFLHNYRWPLPAPVSRLVVGNPGPATPRQAAQAHHRLAVALPLSHAPFGATSPTHAPVSLLRCHSPCLSLVVTAQHPTAPAQTNDKPASSSLVGSVFKTLARTSYSMPSSHAAHAQWSPAAVLTWRHAPIIRTSCVCMPRSARLYKVVT
jgi:hypothetical protein